MRIASAIVATNNTRELADSLVQQLHAQMPATPIDLLLLFLNSSLQPVVDVILQHVRKELHPRTLLACTAEGVLGTVGGTALEVERQPAASALALSLPGVTIESYHFAEEDWQELLSEPENLAARLDGGESLRAFIFLADPFSTPIVQLLAACSKLFPQAPIVGGMTSGIQAAGESRLALNHRIYSSGLVGVSLAGNLQLDCVVSQGCRPIGETFVITKAHRNVIEELNGQAALAAIQNLISSLPQEERELLDTHGLQIGRVIDEGKGNYGRGDFLIRSVIQADRDSGAVAIGDFARPGQTLQFHVRDAKSAAEDFRLSLEGELQLASASPHAALLFSCAGRGTRMFDAPHNDVRTIHQVLGPIPTAGFFAAGELGPVGQQNFIHSFTASLALFRPADPT